MSSQLTSIFKFFIDVERHERLKVFLLTAAFFCVIGGYSVAKELKDSLFLSIVGKDYQPMAKILAMVVLIPAILFYSKLVDVLRRYQLLYFYTIFYAIAGLFCAYFIAHPTIGLANTETSPYRLFGWLIYFFIEGYSPFVVSVFWAFTNSITNPMSAKNNYTIMVAGSKLGGMLMTILAVVLLRCKTSAGECVFSDIRGHQILFILSSLLILLAPVIIYFLMTRVPGKYLHGYEAVYKVEKERPEEKQSAGFLGTLKSMFSGLLMFVKYPYVMGMFGMIFFWEIVNVVLGYIRLGVGKEATHSISEFSAYLLQQSFFIHCTGFFIVLFGTRALINFLGERRSLILVPVITGVLLIYYLTAQSAAAVALVYVLLRSVNYAFAYPLRESLYIPTTKEMKFKSKSWIDAFGQKIAKGCGAYYNVLIAGFADSALLGIHGIFFTLVIGFWILTAHLLGKRFEHAIKNNEVIGVE